MRINEYNGIFRQVSNMVESKYQYNYTSMHMSKAEMVESKYQ